MINLQVRVKDFSLLNTNNIKFLGITLDNKLVWKTYGSELSIKLNKACYAIRAIKSFVSQKALITVYYSYFHSLLKYGIIFWGNSPVNRDIFKIQKRAIRIISGKSCHDYCRLLFKQLNVLTLTSQYIASLLEFVLENRNLFTTNRDTHGLTTCNCFDLHLPRVNLTRVQRGVLYSII